MIAPLGGFPRDLSPLPQLAGVFFCQHLSNRPRRRMARPKAPQRVRTLAQGEAPVQRYDCMGYHLSASSFANLRRFGPVATSMTEVPTFRPQMHKSGRWSVLVTTGHGPDSHVGNFATEKEAQVWILVKSKGWPHPAVRSLMADGTTGSL
jgi:hypothetical protein